MLLEILNLLILSSFNAALLLFALLLNVINSFWLKKVDNLERSVKLDQVRSKYYPWQFFTFKYWFNEVKVADTVRCILLDQQCDVAPHWKLMYILVEYNRGYTKSKIHKHELCHPWFIYPVKLVFSIPLQVKDERVEHHILLKLKFLSYIIYYILPSLGLVWKLDSIFNFLAFNNQFL